jgi:Subtilase family/Fibronectin type-III domain/Peptidase inhibitor I9/PA domain
LARFLRPWAFVGLLAILAAAVVVLPAAGTDDPAGDAAISADFHGKSANGVYLVRLGELPAVAYDGGVSGYAATKPAPGSKIDPNSADVKKYVGYLSSKHDAALSKVGGGQKLYDYGFAVNGFAAKLSYGQAVALASQDDVLSVEPDLVQHADTISSPQFLGLSQAGGTWDQVGGVSNAGENMVIGDVDTGIWPDNPEFSDRTGTGPNGQDGKLGYQQIPGWHGKCTPGENFTASDCNQKLIGAQYFVAGHGGPDSIIPEEFLSARDFDGHGSHTASTAAGNNNTQVTGPNLPAALLGKASGMAPRARIAAYKACWEKPDHSQVDCFSSDTVAAIDQAVADGVDAINYSISGTTTSFLNSVEVAFLFAEDAGVFVAASAGNSGPTVSTVAHPSPWLTTVAASTHTAFQDTITLGNGATYTGTSIVPGVPTLKPVILSTDAGLPGADPVKLAQCFSKSANGGVALLDPAKVSGKIVVCNRGVSVSGDPTNARVDKPAAVAEAGGVGTIIANIAAGAGQVADVHVAPATHVDSTTGGLIKAYVTSAGASATAKFSDGGPVTPVDAPSIAGFSSRGPSLATGDQLKPDIAAPGVDVLAAVAPTNHAGRLWDLESGTSMSSPHIAGLSLLIKQKHPDWTPDMIKSAMMTTAYDLKSGADPFAQGAGQVDPKKFLDPGLVYPSGGFAKYLGFICTTMGNSVSSACPTLAIRPNELNLPSMAIGALAGTDTLHRSVTNVASTTETYTASVQGLTGLNVSVSPSTFTVNPGQAANYAVSFTQDSAAFNAYATGFITLSGDHGHVVRIPVAVQPVKVAAPVEQSASGTTGTLSFSVKTGFNGTMGRTIRGPEVAGKYEHHVNGDPSCTFDTAHPDAAVAAGTASVDTFTTPANARFIRFQTFQSDVSATVHDLDMFVYRTSPSTTTLVSGGPDANEVVSTNSPDSLTAGSTFKVYVFGCGVDAGGGDFTLFAWAGANTVTTTPGEIWTTPPATSPVTIGGTLTETYSWSGLAAGNRFLARTTYTDGGVGLAATNIEISTR